MASKTRTTIDLNRLKITLFVVAFIEGTSLMIVELLGAKIIAPFYGTSLYVWSSVLGVTLVSLAVGYYLGGYLSEKYNYFISLSFILLFGGFFVATMPHFAPNLMNATTDLGVRTGSLVSVLLYLLPPVVAMGMVSPIIIETINNEVGKAGRAAGTVYAVSTIGGILGTFLAGFYLIPNFGIKLTAFLTGVLLILSCVLLFVVHKSITKAVGVLAVFMVLSIYLFAQNNNTNNPKVNVRYQSSGVLGEWTVVDLLANVNNGQNIYTRQLLLNGIDQTYTAVGEEPVSVWYYPHKLSALAGIKPEGSEVLLLGMGGGSIAHNLILLGFEVDIVELDERIPYIAEKWFAYDPDSANLFIDDARHYIKQTEKTYDIVIMDLLYGEVQPSHVFTKEGLTEMKSILKPDALVIVNFQGRLVADDLQQTRASRSVYKTFTAMDYTMYIGKQREQKETSLSDDLLLYGTPGDFDFKDAFKEPLRYNALFPYLQFSPEDYTPQENFPLEDAVVMTDDKQSMEILNGETILAWRKNKMKFIEDEILENNQPLYK